MEEVLRALDFVDAVEVLLQIGIGIREAMSEKLLVIFVSESVGECEAVIGPEKAIVVTFVLVGDVGYLLSDSVPTYAFGFFDLIGEAKDLHAVIVERIGFGEVEDVELHFLSGFRVAHSEKVPLSMSVCVDVILQNKVIFNVRHLDGRKKIARLKPRFKKQSLIIRSLQLVKLLGR